MRLLQAAFERRGDATFTLKDPAIQALRDWFGVGNTVSGVSVTQSTAEGIPVVFACVSLLSDLVADTPLKVYRKLKPRGKTPDDSLPLYSVLHDLPNPIMSAFDFKQCMQWSLLLWGNAYAWIERDPVGRIRGLWPLLPDRMQVVVTDDGTLTYEYRRNLSSEPERWTFDMRRPPILHLRCYSRDGIHGRSPVQVLREAFGEALGARDVANKLWADGMLGTVFAHYPGKLKPVAKQNLREDLKARFGKGVETAHKIGILEEGLKIERLSMPPKDAQFLELRQASKEDLAMVFRVDPQLVGVSTQGAGPYGAGLEQKVLGMLKFTARPWMGLWEKSCNRDLLTYKSFETHECLFVTKALERMDLNSRTEAYERQIRIGMLSPNEAREADDLNPRPGGDEYVTVDAIGAGGNINQAPRQPAAPDDDDADDDTGEE